MTMDDATALADDEAMCMAHISAFLATTPDFGFGSSSSPTSSDTSLSRPSVDNLRSTKRSRPKDEMARLQATHVELERQLQLLQLLRRPQRTLTPWQARARRVAEAAQRSLQENSRLRRLIDDQRKVLDTLERAVTKRPRCAPLDSTSDGSAVAKIPQLVLDHYDKMESEWIRRRLYDAKAPLRQMTVERSAVDGTMRSFSMVAKMSAPLDYTSLGDLFWTHKTGFLGPSCTVQHTITDDVVCTRELIHRPDVPELVLETHDCLGRFHEPGRMVMVWRSLSANETITRHGADHLVGHRWGWLMVEQISKFESLVQCSMTTRVPAQKETPTAVAPAWVEWLLQFSQTSKDTFGGAMETALFARREELGLSNDSINIQVLIAHPTLHREEVV
ncbi:hypothetical protein SDRG_14006 [Saprolegnia diclina VS20]|uniref:START domain-containing protein n=1 Tax=Saprolegnia diclina (strain VS20) TaxID=1156394 RepID=T0Q0U5_SAPDV|nr:hypothetical protein SDRG_14006 [Saprolegnia diclina VS20]EQC28181.1 hypothetical protein SDRG_14006 [Saprolegnia diclina VS20]|eukprot:XP_008618330.1 hypothetical protein SDRG_14006 [Saprolegnia diclina VS20]